MATLSHNYDPNLVAAHLGKPAIWITRESDYLFEDSPSIAAAIAAVVAGDPVPQVVPEFVEALALELALGQAGLLSAVLAYVESQSEQVQSYWWRTRQMRRASPLIEAARVQLGLTPAQVDQLFITAKSLEPHL